METIKVLGKLSKMVTEDPMVKEVAKRELAMHEKQSSKKRRFEAPKKVRAMSKQISQKAKKKKGTAERVVEKNN